MSKSNFKIAKINTISAKLFRLTQEHHRACLRRLFLRHYEPLVIGDKLQPNRQWTVDVNEQVMNSLRLHLTWVLGGEVFQWTDEQIGIKILKLLSNLGVTSSSAFVNHVNE